MTETTESAEDFLKRMREQSMEPGDWNSISSEDLKRLVRIAYLSFPPRMGGAAK